MGTHKKIAAITVMVICLIFISQNSQATGTSTTTTTPAGGNGLDPSFDGDGVAILSGEETDDYFFADIVIQADGKIVAAGGFYNGVYHDGLIARYNDNGSLDHSFGTNGLVKVDNVVGDKTFYAVAVQSDGKIVVTGEAGSSSIVVNRYNDNGTKDTSFGDNGTATYSPGRNVESKDMAIQPDGKILVAGSIGYDKDALIIRYSDNGSLDASFGSDGIVTQCFDYYDDDSAETLLVQPDGKIIVAGETEQGSAWKAFIIRYTDNGTIDTTFSYDGYDLYEKEGTYCHFYDAALQKDGSILAAGTCYSETHGGGFVARYTDNGSRDEGFNGDGIYACDDAIELRGVGTQSDGKIIAAGSKFSEGNRNALVLSVR